MNDMRGHILMAVDWTAPLGAFDALRNSQATETRPSLNRCCHLGRRTRWKPSASPRASSRQGGINRFETGPWSLSKAAHSLSPRVVTAECSRILTMSKRARMTTPNHLSRRRMQTIIRGATTILATNKSDSGAINSADPQLHSIRKG